MGLKLNVFLDEGKLRKEICGELAGREKACRER